MAGYILINLETQAILGQKLDRGGQRPFVSIAEAYETLATLEAMEGAKQEETGHSFNAWRLCQVNPVEKP